MKSPIISSNRKKHYIMLSLALFALLLYIIPMQNILNQQTSADTSHSKGKSSKNHGNSDSSTSDSSSSKKPKKNSGNDDSSTSDSSSSKKPKKNSATADDAIRKFTSEDTSNQKSKNDPA